MPILPKTILPKINNDTKIIYGKKDLNAEVEEGSSVLSIKDNFSLGIKNPVLIEITIIIIPIIEPKIDGNSWPKETNNTEGITNIKPENIAKGNAWRNSFFLFTLPSVIVQSIKTGTIKPTQFNKEAIKGTLVIFNPAKPIFIGVPAAPKTPGALFPKRPTTRALIGGNPKPIKIGTAIAAGVPNPAVPSIKHSKNQILIYEFLLKFLLLRLELNLF